MTGAEARPIPAARPVIDESDIEAVVAVMRSGMVVQGPEVKAFEDEFSELVEGRHCVAVNSGTSALHLTMMALGVGPGDEVIVPVVLVRGDRQRGPPRRSQPVFADIERDSFNIDPAAVEALVGPNTAAIMPVHLYGQPADLKALGEIAAKHGLAVVEDAAQAHGAAIDGKPVGAWGNAGCFSLLPDQEHALARGRHGHHRRR